MIRYLAAILFGTAATFSSVQVAAQSVSAEAPAEPADGTAYDLATILCDKPGMLQNIDPITDYISDHLLTTDSVAIEINEKYPGLDKRFDNTIRPFVERELERRFPFCVTTLSEFYASKLPAPLIAQIKVFFMGEAGKKLIRISAVNEAAAAPDKLRGGNSAQAARASRSEEAANALQELTAQQRQEFMRFATSPAGQAFIGSAAEKDEIIARFASWNFEPGFVAQMTQALNESLEAHVADAEAASLPTQ
jgi:hypothetical protein